MHGNLRATGASSIATTLENNPLDLVKEIIARNPSTKFEELFADFRSMLAARPVAYQRAVDYYFFVNMHKIIVDKRATNGHVARRAPDLVVVPTDHRAATAERHQEREARVQAGIEQIRLLNLEMVNGKLLGDCTGADLAKMGNRFQKLASQVGKTKTVRSVLSEEQVKKILA